MLTLMSALVQLSMLNIFSLWIIKLLTSANGSADHYVGSTVSLSQAISPVCCSINH